MKSHRLTAAIVLVAMAVAPFALAQTTKPKKKGAKGAAAASASASATAADTASASAAAADTSSPTPAPDTSASAAPSASSALPDTPPEGAGLPTDTKEEPGKHYYFVGARYRGNLVPQFLMNLFVNDGATIFSNSFGIELDMRTDGHSTIPWLMYSNYDTGDILFYQKGKPDDPANYSDVKSRLGAIYLGLDELWSTPLDEAHHWDFEYGFGVGLGVLFGTLYNDWVYEANASMGAPNGPLAGTNGNYYAPCTNNSVPMPYATQGAINAAQPGNPANPCAGTDHSNSTDNKVNGYQEKNWFSGGSIPVIFPYISFPQIGVRYKPVKQFEARLGLGFSLTGFWFGISGDYGLEKPGDQSEQPESPKKKGSQGLGLRGNL
jgi:hypothetical protein